MPFKDADYNRDYQREWATKQREIKLEAKKVAHPLGPLGWEGERIIQKWVRKGESMLNKMVLAQQWGIKHRSRLTVYHRSYREENREKIRTVQAEWAENNREKSNGYKTKWNDAHPEAAVIAQSRRRALKLQAPLNDLTTAQWREIKAAFGNRCVYCPPDCKACQKKTHKLTQDHIIPLSKGGPNTASNVVPACRPCNRKKFTGPPLVPVQPLLLTLAPSKRPKSA